MWNQPYRKSDVEAGGRQLYPTMLENPQLRWSFIRKVYSIVSIQLLLTVAVASVVVTVHPIKHFFASTGAGLAVYIVLIITPLIVLFPLYYYHQRHPYNYFLLGIFTVAISFAVGLTCAFTKASLNGHFRDSQQLLSFKARIFNQIPFQNWELGAELRHLTREPVQTDCTKVVYLVRAQLDLMKSICSQIHHDTSKGIQRDYFLYFVPRRAVVCEKILEEEKVHHLLTIGSTSKSNIHEARLH